MAFYGQISQVGDSRTYEQYQVYDRNLNYLGKFGSVQESFDYLRRMTPGLNLRLHKIESQRLPLIYEVVDNV